MQAIFRAVDARRWYTVSEIVAADDCKLYTFPYPASSWSTAAAGWMTSRLLQLIMKRMKMTLAVCSVPLSTHEPNDHRRFR